MVRVTIDTGPWLDLLDRRGCVAEMEQILSWHKSGKVRVFASSRVFDPDTDAMYPRSDHSWTSTVLRLLERHFASAFRV